MSFPGPAYLFPFGGAVLGILGVAGPTLAAVVMMRVLQGRDGPGQLFATLFRRDVSPAWYAVAILGPPFISLLAVWLVLLFSEATTDPVGALPWGAVPIILVGRLLVNVWEEIGWRGFALPQLQGRYSALVASLIIGVFWALWHLPLFWDAQSTMTEVPFILFFVNIVVVSVIYTWLYNNTKGSLLFVTLFHATGNTAGVMALEAGLSFAGYVFAETVVILFISVVLVAVYGPARLSRRRGELPRTHDI